MERPAAILELGLYAEQVRHFIDTFGRDQARVVISMSSPFRYRMANRSSGNLRVSEARFDPRSKTERVHGGERLRGGPQGVGATNGRV
jgi:hypothetical protein